MLAIIQKTSFKTLRRHLRSYAVERDTRRGSKSAANEANYVQGRVHVDAAGSVKDLDQQHKSAQTNQEAFAAPNHAKVHSGETPAELANDVLVPAILAESTMRDNEVSEAAAQQKEREMREAADRALEKDHHVNKNEEFHSRDVGNASAVDYSK